MASVTTIAVVLVAILVVYITRFDKQDNDLVDKVNSTYDYIIVGAGSAGCVLANRLSEEINSSVLLLEAGGSELENDLIRIPFATGALLKSDVDWLFSTEPQKNACIGLKESRGSWSRGKVLGGTSSINYMTYVRGNRYDYDSWAADGCEGWSYKDVLPYFIKSEDIRIDGLDSSLYHGKGGPLAVSDGRSSPLSNVYEAAIKELGYDKIDCNGKRQNGYCPKQANINKGERSSTAAAFLRPVLHRQNLHVSVKSHVTKIIIKDKKAVGVEFIRDGRKQTVMAAKEVILSAGAINSPQILMLSGVGPKEHLQSLGINVEADLPVGNYLKDHLATLVHMYDKSHSILTVEKSQGLVPWTQYMSSGSGPLGKSGEEGNLFIADSDQQAPIVQILFGGFQVGFEFYEFFNEGEEVLEARRQNLIKAAKENLGDLFILFPIILHPKSTGTIRLQSTDPFDYPIINPNYLHHPDDIDVLLKGLKESLKIVNTTAFRNIGSSADLDYGTFPFCKEFKQESDAYRKCRIKHETYPFLHATSTCRMGKASDPTAVVDPQLRVIGIDSLRVVDASVMRDIPSGNTNAPTIMIAEKAADIIREIDSVKSIRQKTQNL